jgi:ABC-type nitrate/sulfonate/bicarbonate transport system substrate-binding protein
LDIATRDSLLKKQGKKLVRATFASRTSNKSDQLGKRGNAMNAAANRGLSRRTWLQALGVGGAAGFLPSAAVFAQSAKKLTIGSLPFANWCQLAAAEHFGWIEKEGIRDRLDIRYFDSGAPEIEAAIGGSLQLIGIGAGPVINALANGALPLRILGSVNEATLLFALIGQKEIGSVADLRGKKIAVTLGTNYQYFLEAALADAGLTTKDVTMIDSQPNEGTIAFLAGRVDATVPDYSDSKIIPRRREGAKVLVTGGDIGKSKGPRFRIFDLWVAPAKSFAANQTAISSVMRGVSHWADYLADPATRASAIDFAVTWASEKSGKALKREDVESTMQGATFFNVQQQKQLVSDGTLATALKQHAEFLVQHNLLKRVPDFNSAVETSVW